MERRRFSKSILLAAILAVITTEGASAQDSLDTFWSSMENPPGLVSGFASLDWGSSTESVIQEWGAPDGVIPQGGVEIVSYTDQLIGGVDAAFMLLFVHPEVGLGRGAYIAINHDRRLADSAFGVWEQAVQNRYPKLAAVRCPPVKADELCERFGALEPTPPTKSIHWISMPDQITLTLKQERGDWLVVLTYTSGAFEDAMLTGEVRDQF